MMKNIRKTKDIYTSFALLVVNAILNLPSDTVCLLPTHSTCNELNKEMLKSLPWEEIRLLAAD